MNLEQEQFLTKKIGQMILPLVSPYDLSKKQLMNQFQNNPYFRATIKSFFDLITSQPLTLKKVIDDMNIISQLNK